MTLVEQAKRQNKFVDASAKRNIHAKRVYSDSDICARTKFTQRHKRKDKLKIDLNTQIISISIVANL